MEKKLLFITFFLSMFLGLQAQEGNRILLRSTTAAAGSSVKINVHGTQYVIEQSLGQTSPIGTFKTENYVVRQGFIQPSVLAKITNPTPLLPLSTVIYPNPFKSDVNISFSETINSNITVTVFTVLGVKIASKSYDATQLLNLSLKYLADGKYFLRVEANNKQFVGTLLKMD